MVIKNIKKYPNPNPNGRFLIDCPGCRERKEHHAKGYCYKCYKKLMWENKVIKCKNCNRIRPHKAFGLCGACHTRLYHYDLKSREITNVCASCGFNKLIALHHLDGDRNNDKDNNLVGLCPNCHKMIRTYQYYEEVKKTLEMKGYDASKVHPANYIKR